MSIKEMLKLTATIIGREDVKSYVEDGAILLEDTVSLTEKLVALSNLVVQELSATFIPMIKKEKVTAKNFKVRYDGLAGSIVQIKNVYDINGNKISFAQTPEYISVNNSQVIIEYECIPPNYALSDEIGYEESDVPQVLLSYGLASEYYVSTGRFEQAVMWHERYVDGINSLRKTKNVNLKSRSFV